MQIRVAKSAGFCFGVRRAIDIAINASKKDKHVYMLDNIVHNEYVVEKIKEAGIKVVKDISNITGGILLLRAHGSIPEIYKKANEKGLEIVDATCPMVLEIHRLVKEMEEQGYQVVIIGDQNHDEVKGIAGQIASAAVVSLPDDVEKALKKHPKIGVVVQSTQNLENVQAIMRKLVPYGRELRFINTICKPTTDHQNEIRIMPFENDVMIVVGSFSSANTRRLTDLSKLANERTFQVETSKGLVNEWFVGAETVGVTAGASTPDILIEEVISAIRLFDCECENLSNCMEQCETS